MRMIQVIKIIINIIIVMKMNDMINCIVYDNYTFTI